MRRLLKAQAVPILFLVLCVFGIVTAQIKPLFLSSEMLIRLGRNSVLVLALIIPILAGLGLNFGIVIGAMAGQAAAILVVHWGIRGLPGFALASLLSVPLAVFLGWLVGQLFNRAKGREMVSGMIAGFFANGIYQFVFLFMVGSVIPFNNPAMIRPVEITIRDPGSGGGPAPEAVPPSDTAPSGSEGSTAQGYGLRNTVDLSTIQYAVDDLIPIKLPLFGGLVRVPLASFLVVGLICLAIFLFFRTKLGQELKAMGRDAHVAEIAGIPVDRNRIIATILSTVLAAWGQLLSLQNLGTLNTYNSHEQVGMFSIAALLVSGATVRRATVIQALIGTALFHTLFVVSPLAGKALAGDAQIGEYFRSFVAYAVITLALVLHAWQAVRRKT